MQQGDCHIPPQARVKLLALGDNEKRGFAPFEQTLRQAGITLVQERADVLVILSLSNYKSFKGHINLSEEELSLARVETRKHSKSILVCLGSPFAAAGLQSCVNGTVHAFCPLEAFQQTAAEILLGRRKAKGHLPVQI